MWMPPLPQLRRQCIWRLSEIDRPVQSWFSMPVNLALGKLRQGNDKFEIGYIASSRPS